MSSDNDSEVTLYLPPDKIAPLIVDINFFSSKDLMRRDIKEFQRTQIRILRIKSNLNDLGYSSENIEKNILSGNLDLSESASEINAKKIEKLVNKYIVEKNNEKNIAYKLKSQIDSLSIDIGKFKSNINHTFGATIKEIELPDRKNGFLSYKTLTDNLLRDIDLGFEVDSTFGLVSAIHNYVNLSSLYADILDGYVSNEFPIDLIIDDPSYSYESNTIDSIDSILRLIVFIQNKLSKIYFKIEKNHLKKINQFNKIDNLLDDQIKELQLLESNFELLKKDINFFYDNYPDLGFFTPEVRGGDFVIQGSKSEAITAFSPGESARWVSRETVNYLNKSGANIGLYRRGRFRATPRRQAELLKPTETLQQKLEDASSKLVKDTQSLANDANDLKNALTNFNTQDPPSDPIEKEHFRQKRKELRKKYNVKKKQHHDLIDLGNRMKRFKNKFDKKKQTFLLIPERFGPLFLMGIECVDGEWVIIYGPRW